MSKELVLAKSLEAAGISTQITTADLIDVVADDIFNKTMSAIRSYQDEAKELEAKFPKMFSGQLESMKEFLFKGGYISKEDSIVAGWDFVREGASWPYVSIYTITMEERAQGLKINSQGKEYGFYYPKKDMKEVEVKLYVDVSEYEKEDAISKNGITGTKTTTTKSEFRKRIKVPVKPFLQYVEEINDFNKRLFAFGKSLPDGLLSVDKYAKEARIKMTKKMLSTQPKDFKEKMYQLFNIKL